VAVEQRSAAEAGAAAATIVSSAVYFARSVVGSVSLASCVLAGKPPGQHFALIRALEIRSNHQLAALHRRRAMQGVLRLTKDTVSTNGPAIMLEEIRWNEVLSTIRGQIYRGTERISTAGILLECVGC
jgi:hypothetical protein